MARIVITCDHGKTERHLTRELPTAVSNEGWCEGGRVLDPGSYDEVQWCKRHRSAMHDHRCDYALWKGYVGDPNNCDRIVVWQLDALTGEQP